MKVEKLISKNQPPNWLNQVIRECHIEYPMHLVDISPLEQVLDIGYNEK
tara:strand:- start:275 stop:421 length:147 start_codon:yes stop_codon:yes gene_type:complete